MIKVEQIRTYWLSPSLARFPVLACEDGEGVDLMIQGISSRLRLEIPTERVFPAPALRLTLSAHHGECGPHTPYPPRSRFVGRERGGSKVIKGDSAAAKPPPSPPTSCAPDRRGGSGQG